MNRTGTKDRIQFDLAGQYLEYEAPQGRPDADGTVTLYDPRLDPDDSDAVIVTGTATRRALAITMNGAAGPSESDPRNIPVLAADITSIAAVIDPGDFLWLESASHERERIEVLKIGAASIGARHPLQGSYASGATIRSAVMRSPAIPTAWIQDEDHLLLDCWAKWVYAFDGRTYTVRSYFDVVREVPATEVTVDALLQVLPDLNTKLVKQEELRGFIREAQGEVDHMLVGRGLEPTRLRGNEAVKRLVLKRAALLAAVNARKPNNRDPERFVDWAAGEWSQAAAAFTEGKLPIPYDSDEDDQLGGDRGKQVLALDR